ncbi:hypothetical protein J4450_04365 [Candidatus Micrarchaeota archaeon]|nr:hypothetical protein [Candidatus Micrarchaeota archaeon]
MGPMKIFYDAVFRNKDALTVFIDQLLGHNGRINPNQLFKVEEYKNRFRIAKSHNITPDTRSILIGIEICNSYSPLYELDYFLMSLFLSTVASALPLDSYSKLNYIKRKEKIMNDLLSIKKDDISDALENPEIAIIGMMTDDIEPYRYSKHQLWGLQEFKKRCIDIKKPDYYWQEGNAKIFKNLLWMPEDIEHANFAVENSSFLYEAKMLQSYLSIKKFLEFLSIDISKVPFFFSLTPNYDIRENGAKNSFLDLLLELHSQKQLKVFKKIIQKAYPPIIKTACPACGETSKKIITGHIRGKNRRRLELHCLDSQISFKTELAVGGLARKGCGNKWSFELPFSKYDLYDELKNGVSLYFPVNSLMWLINDISFAPAALVFTDAGFYKADGKINILPRKSIGDHKELLTNMISLQDAFLKADLCPEVHSKLKSLDMLVNKAPILFGHQSPTKLFDPSLSIISTISDKVVNLHVTDSSIFVAMKHGLTPEKILEHSLYIDYFYPKDIIRSFKPHLV